MPSCHVLMQMDWHDRHLAGGFLGCTRVVGFAARGCRTCHNGWNTSCGIWLMMASPHGSHASHARACRLARGDRAWCFGDLVWWHWCIRIWQKACELGEQVIVALQSNTSE